MSLRELQKRADRQREELRLDIGESVFVECSGCGAHRRRDFPCSSYSSTEDQGIACALAVQHWNRRVA